MDSRTSEGIAKFTPDPRPSGPLRVYVAVHSPINCPAEFVRAPPLVRAVTRASVCIAPVSRWPADSKHEGEPLLTAQSRRSRLSGSEQQHLWAMG